MSDIELPVGRRSAQYRFFEILPGALSYLLLIAPVALSFIDPFIGAVFVLLYIMSFFVRAINMSYWTVQAYSSFRRSENIDWVSRLADLEDPESSLLRDQSKSWKANIHTQNLKRLATDSERLRPSDLLHGVIIATVNESRDVIDPTIESLLHGDYDPKHIVLVIGYEGRAGKETKARVQSIIDDYGHNFYATIMAEHPPDIPYEVIGKGGNITYAGRKLQEWLDEQNIDPRRVMVTTLDCDNKPHKSYFSYLSYEYITHPDPRHVSFQPMALYMNNIWDVPAPMRVIATGNSFWNLINSHRPHMLRNFAAHSQPMAALIDTDFWSTRSIVEDGHQYWRSYFRYDGEYDVVPIYLPIYQDAVLSETYLKTLKAQFIQLRRWAYGASDVPYVATRLFSRSRTAPFWGTLVKFARLLEGHVTWAVTAPILFCGAWMPLFLNPDAGNSLVAHRLPEIVSDLQRVAMIGIFISIFFAFKLLPPRPPRYKRHRYIGMLLQWLLMPITSIVYGSASALNSQTRLLAGRYMDKFDLTEKAVKK